VEPKRRKKGAAIVRVSPNNKQPLIVAGPTGVGKSIFAVELALRFGGEIIGADAYQVYAGMGVLTAQPGPELTSQVPHHLMGILDPSERFDAARFAAIARETMAKICARGRRPILVGGSGLYLKALTHGLAELPPVDPALRAELSALSPDELRERLDRADPEARRHIDFQNPRRVLRALEIHHQTGRTTARQRELWDAPPTLEHDGILLVRERTELMARIEENVRTMLTQNVVEEVMALGEIGPTAAMAIGLREIQALARGEATREETQRAITLATGRYAKRQLTWFRNQFSFNSMDLTGLRNVGEFPFNAFFPELA
jgi:tRNA dimethylallyltransferase